MDLTISLDQQLINYETTMNQLADRYSYKAPERSWNNTENNLFQRRRIYTTNKHA